MIRGLSLLLKKGEMIISFIKNILIRLTKFLYISYETRLMKNQLSLLIADEDQGFRELILNYLLISGYDRIKVAKGRTELARILARAYFKVILIDYNIFQAGEIKTAIENSQKRFPSKIIIMLDDEQQQLINSAQVETADLPCILKSFMKQYLSQSL
jgi:AmiR/NasT family two-component response regulator